jgi:hypothetical protein
LGSELAGLSSTELEARSQGQVRIVDGRAGGTHTIRSLLVCFGGFWSHIEVLKRNFDMNGCRKLRYRCQGGKRVRFELRSRFEPVRLSDNILSGAFEHVNLQKLPPRNQDPRNGRYQTYMAICDRWALIPLCTPTTWNRTCNQDEQLEIFDALKLD